MKEKNKKMYKLYAIFTIGILVFPISSFAQLHFVKGVHRPEKRVHQDKNKVRNLKALEVHKQPEHGRKLADFEKELGAFDQPKEKTLMNTSSLERLKQKKVTGFLGLLVSTLSDLFEKMESILTRISVIEKEIGLENKKEDSQREGSPEKVPGDVSEDSGTQDINEDQNNEKVQDESREEGGENVEGEGDTGKISEPSDQEEQEEQEVIVDEENNPEENAESDFSILHDSEKHNEEGLLSEDSENDGHSEDIDGESSGETTEEESNGSETEGTHTQETTQDEVNENTETVG